jgi:hypothetical protein
MIMVRRKFLDRLPISFSHLHVPVHQDISRDEMDIWGRANDDCDTDAKAFWKKEEAACTLVTSTYLCDDHGHYGYEDKNFHRMLKETCTTLSMTQKQQRPGDYETYRIPRTSCMSELSLLTERRYFLLLHIAEMQQRWDFYEKD